MSQVETVKSIYRTFGQGDVDGVLACFADDVEWVTPTSLPWSRGRYHGVDGVREYFGAFLAALEEPSVAHEELIDASGRVVAVGHERGRCRTTGRDFAARFVHVWTVADGKVLRMEGVADTAAITAAFAGESAAV